MLSSVQLNGVKEQLCHYFSISWFFGLTSLSYMVLPLRVISAMGHNHLGAYSVGMSSGLAVDAGSQLGVHVRCQLE